MEMKRLARSRASDWKPELKAGWPQHVWAWGKGKLHALVPQHLYHSLAYLGIELVHEACDEDGGAGLGFWHVGFQL